MARLPRLQTTLVSTQPAGKSDGKPPNDLDALEKSVNDASRNASASWLSFISFATLVLITVSAVTHRKLILEEPMRIPVLNADVPLLGFFFLMPLFFLIFHFYLLLQLHGLADRARAYHIELYAQQSRSESRALLRLRIDTFVFAQLAAGRRERREGRIGRLYGIVALFTTALLPLVTLIVMLTIFLPYHHEALTWWHRLAILADLLLLRFFWPVLRPMRSQRRQRNMRLEGSRIDRRPLSDFDCSHPACQQTRYSADPSGRHGCLW